MWIPDISHKAARVKGTVDSGKTDGRYRDRAAATGEIFGKLIGDEVEMRSSCKVEQQVTADHRVDVRGTPTNTYLLCPITPNKYAVGEIVDTGTSKPQSRHGTDCAHIEAPQVFRIDHSITRGRRGGSVMQQPTRRKEASKHLWSLQGYFWFPGGRTPDGSEKSITPKFESDRVMWRPLFRAIQIQDHGEHHSAAALHSTALTLTRAGCKADLAGNSLEPEPEQGSCTAPVQAGSRTWSR
ncbi:unnamed protein product [Pleuronectes platessa]|uniref:Uncharacterized protein n=1 Tax=Pleuronectes platessa TaxID=8262 RepID=A0A9N7V1I8_PLEPL|nr:unnamed protein product [Pleuronectes platessa]